MAIQHLQDERGNVVRVGERQARAMVESGRFSYLTGSLAETQAPKKTAEKKKAGRPKKSAPTNDAE
jgi:hypothetical protein